MESKPVPTPWFSKNKENTVVLNQVKVSDAEDTTGSQKSKVLEEDEIEVDGVKVLKPIGKNMIKKLEDVLEDDPSENIDPSELTFRLE